MLLFPNAKINIGLKVLRRRADGYHDISTVMVPIGWCDMLEMIPSEGKGSFTMLGCDTLGLINPEDNLVIKALRALERHIGKSLPPTDIYLKKIIPSGAGLGGGSSDAAFAVKGANELYQLGLTQADMASIVSKVGADCPFFIYNRPMLAEGIGEILSEVDIPELDKLWVTVVKPQSEAVSTKAAYAGVTPAEIKEGQSLQQSLNNDANTWRKDSLLSNDFEQSIFAFRPQVAEVKWRMDQLEALYTAMSGSGAAVYGLFDSDKMAEIASTSFKGCDIYVGKLSSSQIS